MRGIAFSLVVGLLIGACLGQPGSRTAPSDSRTASTTAPAGQKSKPPADNVEDAERLCRQGNGAECLNAGLQYKSAKDEDRALALFARACELGDAGGCLNEAIVYLDGKHVPQDLQKAAQLTRKSCDLGLSVSCGIASDLAKDPTLKRRLAEKGCEAGASNGCASLGMLMTSAETPEFAQGKQLLETACQDTRDPGGAAGACKHLGYLHELGTGVSLNLETAVRFYRKACELAAHHCNFLADAHLHGRGVEQSKQKAKELFQRACDAGNHDGCEALQFIDKPQDFGGMKVKKVGSDGKPAQ